MRKHKHGARFLAATILVLASVVAVADWPPPFVNYQGVLRDYAGNPLNGTYDMVFRFFTDGGDEILIDRHTAAQGGAIVVSNGLFDVYLGGGVREDGSGPGTYTVLWDVFRDHQIVYVEVQIGADDDPEREVLSPRTRILAAAYAMNSSSLAGLESASLLRSDATDAYTTGTLTFNGGTVLDVNGTLNMDGAVTKATTDHVPNFNADLLDGLQATAFARPNLGNSWSGLNTFHRIPTGTALYGGSIVIDPASAGGNFTLFGVGVGGQERLRIDAEGDLVAKGSVNVSGTIPAIRIQNDAGASLSTVYSSDSQNYSYFHDTQNSRYMLYSNPDGIGIGTNTVSSTFMTTTPSLWVSGTTLALNGRLDMDENGPDQNQNIYFYNNSSATSEYLRWDDAQDRFELSDQLAVYGPIRAGSYTAAPVNYHYFGTGGGPDSPTNITGWSDVYVEGDVEIDGNLLLNDNLYLHDGSATTPFWQYIHFWDSGSFSEHIVWNRYLVSQFQISDDLLVQGNLAATGTKPFVQNHPYDPDLSVYYVALEGDEAGTYTRGSGRLRDGEARIRLGETFSWVTNPEIGLTAHVTSRSPDAVVYVESVSTEELVVRNVSGFTVDAEFDYIVHGLRMGYEEFQSVQPRTTQAPVPSEAYYARQREEHPELQRETAAARFAAMDRPGGRTAGLGSQAERALRESIGEYDPDFDDPNREALAAAMQAEDAKQRGSTPGTEPAEPGPAASEATPSIDAPPDSWAVGVANVEESIPEEKIPEARNFHPLFTVSEEVEPGDLLTLDPSRPGSLIRAAIAQDPGVVGIVAGPTITIEGEIRASVALSDLATVKADAGYGEIRAGDLLTSSFTTGHAMVALEIVPGTIIGKALEPLETGTGLIKVLVMPR